MARLSALSTGLIGAPASCDVPSRPGSLHPALFCGQLHLADAIHPLVGIRKVGEHDPWRDDVTDVGDRCETALIEGAGLLGIHTVAGDRDDIPALYTEPHRISRVDLDMVGWPALQDEGHPLMRV